MLAQFTCQGYANSLIMLFRIIRVQENMGLNIRWHLPSQVGQWNVLKIKVNIMLNQQHTNNRYSTITNDMNTYKYENIIIVKQNTTIMQHESTLARQDDSEVCYSDNQLNLTWEKIPEIQHNNNT